MTLLIVNCKAVEKIEINRKKSPDSKVEAVLTRINSGATSSYAYYIYIVPSGEDIKNYREIFKADNVQNLEIIWKKDKLLYIKYKKGRIFHFTNFWHSKKIQNYEYQVKIQLILINNN